jgi:hypothetical protein
VGSVDICKDRRELQPRRFELVAFVLEVEDDFEDLEEP